MAEYKKEIAVAGTIALVAALGVGLFAIAAFPNGPAAPPVGIVRPLIGYVSARDVSCSLATGTCTMTLLNNSTVPLTVEGCQLNLILSSNDTVTSWHMVQGTTGGPVVAGVPAGSSFGHGSSIPGSCTVPTSEFSHQVKGSLADGLFVVKLADNWYGYPAGTQTVIGFDSTWL